MAVPAGPAGRLALAPGGSVVEQRGFGMPERIQVCGGRGAGELWQVGEEGRR